MTQILFKTPFGSHLYGTATETSDIDTKMVVLPDFESLIMNYRLANKVVKPDGWIEGTKMNAGKEEIEVIPLQVFLDQFYEGQTYAVEMVFAVLQDLHEDRTNGRVELKAWMQELVNRFMTNGVQKMVGYAIAQSRIYGLKNGRYNKLVEFSDLITARFKDMEPGWVGRLADRPDFIEELVAGGFVEHDQILNARGGTELAPAIKFDDKQFALTTSWQTLHNNIIKMVEKYGARVRDNTGEAVDWKALSHAIRITSQILELAKHKRIQFPSANAANLLAIKKGEIPYAVAKAQLDEMFGLIDSAIASSGLPERTDELDEEFKQWKLNLLKKYYNLT